MSTSDYDKEKLQERLAKLSGGVAVLKVTPFCFLELPVSSKKFFSLNGMNMTNIFKHSLRLEELAKQKLVRRKIE